MRLKDFKITARLYGGFGVLILLGTAIAGSGVWQLGSIGDQVARLVRVADNNARTIETGGLIQEMLYLALKYKSTGDDAAAKQFDDVQARAAELTANAVNGSSSEDRRRRYSDLSSTLAEARQSFDELVELSKKVSAERANLLAAAAEFDAAMQKLLAKVRSGTTVDLLAKAGDVESGSMAIRLSNLRFLANSKADGATSFKVAVDRTNAALDMLEKAAPDSETRALVAPVRDLVKRYQEGFDRQVAAVTKMNEVFNQTLSEQLSRAAALERDTQNTAEEYLHKTKGDTDGTISTTTSLQAVLAVVGVFFGVGFALLMGRSIAGPIAAMTTAMTALAGGNKTLEIPARDRKDEVGAMAHAVEVFRRSMLEADRLAAEQREEQSRKERRQQAIDEYLAAFDRSVQESLKTLASAANEMRATAESMTSTAEETQRQAATVASASEQTSANVQTVAASAEEMSSSIAEISRQVTQASTIARQAVEEAERTNGTVTTLADAAQKIGQVVQLIQDIASQTNLLALNATIEAARAGDAGKGFAVVASEVKSLATQTAKATEEIAAQIGSIQGVTTEAVGAIQRIGGTIGRISEISTAIASAVEEQGAATHEIARNTQEAAKGTEQVSSNIAGVNRAAGDTSAAADQVLSSSQELGRQSELLRREVDGFLEKIRAA